MKIYFDGCSWTKGEELEHPQEERYSKLICDELDAEETNLAANGGSNDRIVRNLLVENNIEEYDAAVIQMTYPARTEYYDAEAISEAERIKYKPDDPNLRGGWVKVNPKHNYSRWMNRKKDKNINIDNLKEKFEGHKQFWKEYYVGVVSKNYITTKEKIHYLTIKNHCEVKGIPLILCTINQWTDLKAIQLNVKSLSYHRHGHPTKESHRVIADHILKKLRGVF